jgi:hypothetical protein
MGTTPRWSTPPAATAATTDAADAR